MWTVLPGLLVLCSIVLGVWISIRWEIHWEDADFSDSMVVESVGRFVRWICATSLILALVLFALLKVTVRKLEWPGWKSIVVVSVFAVGLGVWVGVLPLVKNDLEVRARVRLRKLEDGLQVRLEAHCKEARYAEAVAAMEEVVAAHEEVVGYDGLSGRDKAIGFSHLFVSLYPVSGDLSQRLGDQVSEFLFLRWYDGGWYGEGSEQHDPLLSAMKVSGHPLLRATACWVSRDYEAFSKEAFAGAAAGDQRMDAMALIAACSSADRTADLKQVEPILNRGVGLGWEMGRYRFTASDIRSFLEGKTTTLPFTGGLYFMNPPLPPEAE